jgi:BlaI family transcriptional regulator, penicillinase repressor
VPIAVSRASTAAAVAQLSRRERQIMDLVYRHGHLTAAEIHERLPEPPVAAAVRTMLRILEEKGHLRHEKEGPRHVYYPTTPRNIAQRSAVRHLLGTFFGGSRAAAVAALLDESDRPLSDDERAELAQVIKKLRAEGK